MKICVFCGSSTGSNETYRRAAESMGRELVKRKIDLVYGGGSIGLMGILADTVLRGGGQVFGVIPESMSRKEVAHHGVTKLYVVEGMHPRKAKMAELSQAFVALPGGFGTYEELFEVITWSQLRFHRKPVGALNVEGYFDPLMNMVDHGIKEGFISAANRGLITMRSSVTELFDTLIDLTPPEGEAWFEKDEI